MAAGQRQADFGVARRHPLEFGHRLAAGTVVILTLVLMAYAWRAEPRRWVRNLVMLAFGLIIVQAVLGGITVLLELPLAIAVTHAATAQALFCLMVSIAIFTNPNWETTPHVDEPPSRIPLPALAVATTAIIYMQILVGALMRHMSAGLVIPDFPLSFGYAIPPYWNEYIAVNFAHRCGAVVVTAMVLWTVARVLRTHRDVTALRRPALGLFLLLILQICLGAITIWSGALRDSDYQPRRGRCGGAGDQSDADASRLSHSRRRERTGLHR